MALKKAIELPSGVIALYWKVVGIAMDDFAQNAQVVLLGFISKEARDNGKQPVPGARVALPIQGATYKALAATVVGEGQTLREANATASYRYAKAFAPSEDEPGPFADAEDV